MPFVFIGALLFGIAVWFVLNLIVTSVVIWSVGEIWDFSMSFWPAFWLIYIVGVVIGGSRATNSK